MSQPLKNAVCIDAYDAEDANKVDVLETILHGKIAVNPQFVCLNPVVPVDGAGASTLSHDNFWLSNLDDYHVWVGQLGLVKLSSLLALDIFVLDQTARFGDKEPVIPV